MTPERRAIQKYHLYGVSTSQWCRSKRTDIVVASTTTNKLRFYCFVPDVCLVGFENVENYCLIGFHCLGGPDFGKGTVNFLTEQAWATKDLL